MAQFSRKAAKLHGVMLRLSWPVAAVFRFDIAPVEVLQEGVALLVWI
jgi:hypothetical protein